MKYIVFLLLIFFTGCVSTYNIPQYSSVSTSEEGSNPKLNVISKADVGSTIYREFNYNVTPTIRLEEDLENNQLSFPADSKFLALKENDRIIYSSVSTNLGNYISDFDNDGKIDHIKTKENILKDWTPIDNPIPYKDAKSIKNEDSQGFELELVYQGKTQNSVKVLYREYKGNLARSPFTQNVEYELNAEGNTEIVFKGAKIEIQNASSNTLTYKVIQGFDIDL